MKLTPQAIREIFFQVKEKRPNIQKTDITNAVITPVDIYDNLRISAFEEALKCQLNRKKMYKMIISKKVVVYLYSEDDETPSLIFIVMITKDK